MSTLLTEYVRDQLRHEIFSSTEFCSGFNKDTLCRDTAEEYKFALMEFALRIKVALSSLTVDNHNSSRSRA